MKHSPLVSVILPTHNSEPFIRETTQSILKQDYRNIELILIDDRSKDRTLEILSSIKDERSRWYQNSRNCGIAYTRNRGLALARGHYVTFFDHDDLMLPGAIKKRADYLRRNKDVNMVCGYTKILYQTPNKNGGKKSLEDKIETRIWGRLRAQKSALGFLRRSRMLEKDLFFRFYFIFTLLTNLMFRKRFLNRLGKFDSHLPYLNDVDFTCHAIQKSPIAFIDRPIKKYRIHGHNKSLLLSDATINADWQRIGEKYFQPAASSL